jgi:hypothetical protein
VRSTRAAHAIARLNSRSEGKHFTLAITGSGLLILRERIDGSEKQLSAPLALDDFVALLDSMGPQKTLRITRSDAAFMKQLKKSPP